MSSEGEDGRQPSLEEALREVENLRQENERLRQDLEECKDQLFDVLQQENDVSEQSIKDAFHSLFSGIEAWVDELSHQDGFMSIFHDAYKLHLQKKESFSVLGLEPRYYSNITWLAELQKMETCHLVVISMMISEFVIKDFFRVEKSDDWGNIYPHGISDRSVSLLVSIQESMRDNLERGLFLSLIPCYVRYRSSFADAPQPDETDISRWRGQAVSALLATQKASELTEREEKRCLTELKQKVESWLGPGLVSKQLSESLMSHVIVRATEALNLMCSSKKTYEVGSLPLNRMPEEGKYWPVTEIDTWKKTSASGVKGIVHCLYPGVMRFGARGQDNLFLVQPTLLGYQKPQHRPPPSPPASRASSPKKRDLRRRDREGHESGSSKGNQKPPTATQQIRTNSDSNKSQRTRSLLSWIGSSNSYSFPRESGPNTQSPQAPPRKSSTSGASSRLESHHSQDPHRIQHDHGSSQNQRGGRVNMPSAVTPYSQNSASFYPHTRDRLPAIPQGQLELSPHEDAEIRDGVKFRRHFTKAETWHPESPGGRGM